MKNYITKEERKKIFDKEIKKEIQHQNEEMNKIPYMLIVGEQEATDGTVSVRKHSEGDLGIMTVEEFSELINKEIENNIVDFNNV